MKYRKKPVEIDAFIWYYEMAAISFPEWFVDAVVEEKVVPNVGGTLFIETLEGRMIAQSGDYIIKGVKEEIYPCRRDIFEMTYEKVNDE
jgi:hypothetical protein